MTTTYTEEANLGLATTEEMLRELICRFSGHRPHNPLGHREGINRCVTLAEMLGSLSTAEREYRTVD
jgi:hypothetical protein